jgi:hypothetical protein
MISHTDDYRLHRPQVSDLALDEREDLAEVEDHTPCEGPGCDRTICRCETGPCDGAVEQACGHYTPLCDECYLTECVECRAEIRAEHGGW